MNIFKEQDGTFSWRKALTAGVLFIFMFAAIGFLFGLKQLPGSYLAIITMVFVFYFVKRAVEGLKLTNANNRTK